VLLLTHPHLPQDIPVRCLPRLPRAACAVAVLGVLAAGCGGGDAPPLHLKDVSGVTVKGQLVQRGQLLKIAKDETIHITFVSTDDDKVASTSEFNPEDGTFEVKGPTGKGLPPGKYKVGLASDRTDAGIDRFEEVFNTQSTPLVAEIGSEEGQFFVIDVGTRKVTRK
jgi:hypothetical protein